jgi:hypothetical protein
MSTSELSGSWTYRSFNPKYGTATQEDQLVLADAVLTLRSSEQAAQAGNLQGAIEWQEPDPSDPTNPTKVKTEGLDLNGTFVSGPEIFDYARFEIVGTGRPGTVTDGWEYRYHGHLSWQWARGPEGQTPTLVGSVIRVKPHGVSKAGEVFSFIALKREHREGASWGLPWILAGSWTYRSFRNDPNHYYLKAPPPADGLILQEADLKLEITTDIADASGSVRGGTIELPGGVRYITLTRIRSAEDPPEFSFGTEAPGIEYHFAGHLTRKWPNEASDQRRALVGTVNTRTGYLDADRQLGPVFSVYPFIAVKQ